MKQILQKAGPCLLIFIVLSAGSFAQTQKGDWLVGGLLQLNTAKNSTSFEFSPNAGYFVLDNFAVGARLVTAYEQLGDLNITSFGFGPFARYYFSEKNIKPFFAADFDFQNQKFKTDLGSVTENAFNYFLGGGVAFFINDNVAVEGLLGYRHTKVKEEEGNGGLNFRVGFQVYITRHQAQSVKSSLSK
jgi:Outer membrane protein beta-barrel domain